MWGDDGIVHPPARGRRRADLETFDDRSRTTSTRSIVAALPQTSLFSARFRECAGSCAVVAASPSRSAHAAVAAASTRRRSARGGVEVPDVPDPARDVARVPAGRVRRAGAARGARPAAVAAVRLVHVDTAKSSPMASSLLFNWIAAYMYEGDAPLAERRAAALVARPRPARATCSAPRSCASCSTRGARRRRARTATPRRRAPGPLGRRAARRAAARSATSPRPRSTCAARSRSRAAPAPWAARRAARPAPGDRDRRRRRDRASPRPTTPHAIATRSAARCRSGCRWRSPTRCRDRSRSSSAGSPARTARSSTADVARRFGVLGRAGRRRARRARGARSASSVASSAPTACSASGATSTCCVSCAAGRWPRCAARSSRSSSEALARFLPAWQGVGATRRGLDALVEALGRARRCADRGVDARARRARRSGRRLPLGRCSTSCARAARWCGSAPVRSAPTTARPAVLRRSGGAARAGLGASSTDPRGRMPRRRSARCSPSGAPMFWGQLRAPTPIGHRRGAARGAVGSRVGRRGHERLARAAAVGARGDAARRASPRRAGGSAASRPRPGRPRAASARRRGAGRWSLVAPLLRAACPTATEAAHAQALQLARALRRRHPRSGAGRGGRRRVRLGVRRVEGARGARPGAPRVLRRRARRRPVRRARRGRPAALPARAHRRARRRADIAGVVLAATDPAQPYGAAPGAGRDIGRAPGAHRRRARGAGRRGAAGVVRPALAPSRHVRVGPRRSSWVDALAGLVYSGALRAVEIRKVNGDTLAASPDAAWVRAAALAGGFADSYHGLALRQR